jgi:hypothetical protein
MGIDKNKRPTAGPGRSEFVTAGSTGTALPFRGVVVIYSTAASKFHNLSAPDRPGAEVEIVCRAAGTGKLANVKLPTGYALQTSSNSTAATIRKIVFNSGNQMIRLRSISTAKFAYLKSTGAVVTTT